VIHEVEVEGFRGLLDVRVPLERFSVVVGANATGKSSCGTRHFFEPPSDGFDPLGR
jgi:predicted ATPase